MRVCHIQKDDPVKKALCEDQMRDLYYEALLEGKP